MSVTGRKDQGPSSVREIAVRTLAEWSQHREYAQDLLDKSCRRAGLSVVDASFLHSMVLAVIRNLDVLDHWIAQLSSHGHLDHRTRDVIRIGLAQLFILDLAPHAAVNETVAIAGKARGLVNAVLRRADRERDALSARAERLPLAQRTSHPDFLVARWTDAFGIEIAKQICDWNQMPSDTYIRVNPLHPQAASWVVEADGLEPVGHGFYRCERLPREAIAAGWCYVQDPSTGVAPRLLTPQPGELVLDACAAPGGKTALMAGLMQNEGRIIACDVSAFRLNRVRENMERMNVQIAECFDHDITSEKVAPWGDLMFDRILLDVPCSNTGVMRRRVDVRWRLQAGDFAKLGQQQERLLLAGLALLKAGGSLVYSTCSIDSEEDHQVVRRVLDASPGFRLKEETSWLPGVDGFDGAYAALITRD